MGSVRHWLCHLLDYRELNWGGGVDWRGGGGGVSIGSGGRECVLEWGEVHWGRGCLYIIVERGVDWGCDIIYVWCVLEGGCGFAWWQSVCGVGRGCGLGWGDVCVGVPMGFGCVWIGVAVGCMSRCSDWSVIRLWCDCRSILHLYVAGSRLLVFITSQSSMLVSHIHRSN